MPELQTAPALSRFAAFFFIDLKTMDKLKNTAWFEVNRTFGCRGIIVYISCGHLAPSPASLGLSNTKACV